MHSRCLVCPVDLGRAVAAFGTKLWKPTCFRALCVLLGSVAALGCRGDDGRFFIEFEWAPGTETPAPGSVEVYASVIGPDIRLNATPRPALFEESGTRLTFREVPYDSILFVEVRMTPTGQGDSTNGPRYFGRSRTFDLQPGLSKSVRVEMALQDGPGIATVAETATTGVVIVNSIGGRVSTSELQVEVRARGAETLQVAQDFLFVQGLREFDAESQRFEGAAIGLATYRLTYDLNDTLERCDESRGGDPSDCEGSRQIFVRAVRDALRSPAEPVEVILDTEPPNIAASSVVYSPGPTNPLPQVEKAKDGTTIIVTLVFTEPVRVDARSPVLSASNGDDTLVFMPSTSLDRVVTSATFTVEVDGTTHGDGLYLPFLSVEDLVGNRADTASFARPTIEVDTTAERLIVDQNKVSYVRAPVGNAAAEPLGDPEDDSRFTVPPGPSFYAVAPADGLDPSPYLEAGTFRLDGGADLSALRIWADADRLDLLRTARPDQDGRWNRDQLKLPNRDAPKVWITGIDEAGNESPSVPIVNMWWVGSSAQPGSGIQSHDLTTAGSLRLPLEAFTSVSNRDALSSPDATGLRQRASRAWRKWSFSPPARRELAASYDSVRGRVVMFGGLGIDAGFLSDTWEWDGATWREATPAAGNPNPRARAGHAMAYDSVRGRTVLFGGQNFRLADTWEWDGIRWTEVTPASGLPNPAPRTSHAMVYDSVRQRVVLFGGLDGGDTELADTWEWDGTAWAEVTAPEDGPNPPATYDHAMAYDSVRGRVVLFGGNGGLAYLEDVWEWDGASWTSMPAASEARPGGRLNHAMVFDAVRQRVLVAGGQTSPFELTNELWSWDGARWAELKPPSGRPVPPARRNPLLVFDHHRDRLVLYGGLSPAVEDLADTWEWDGQAWELVARPPTPGPAPRVDHALASDADRRRVVLFGGQEKPPEALADTWEWDGLAWAAKTPPVGSPNPPPRIQHSMVYDEARSVILLFGGIDRARSGPPSDQVFGDTWTWDGAEWREVTPDAGDSPGARRGHGLAYDSTRELGVLFGGDPGGLGGPLADTWEWDGEVWAQVTPPAGEPSPSPRVGHAMAYDPGRRRVVLFGGGTGSSDTSTWEWDGATWHEFIAGEGTTSPSTRGGHAMAFDPARGRVVLFGGNDAGQNSRADTWEWDGAHWIEVTAASVDVPIGRRGHALARDPDSDRLLLFGGDDNGFFPNLSDVWVLDFPSRPVAQLAVRLPPDVLHAAWSDVRVRAFCGGDQTPITTGAVGAELVGWVTSGLGLAPGSWRTLATNEADLLLRPLADARLDYRAGSPETANQFRGPDDRMYFQCRPLADGGSGLTELALDYFEVRLKISGP